MGGCYYTTKQGDMWDYIAYLIYGDEYKMSVLLEANPQWIDVYIFDAGIKLWCPELSISEESEGESVPDWRDAEDIEDESDDLDLDDEEDSEDDEDEQDTY